MSVDVQVFTSGSGYWFKPAWATLVRVVCVGGGGGGGGGDTAVSASPQAGGGGGGGASTTGGARGAGGSGARGEIWVIEFEDDPIIIDGMLFTVSGSGVIDRFFNQTGVSVDLGTQKRTE